jgi:pyruvate,water dikinase
MGSVCVLRSASEIARFVPGSVLVTSSTDPDWVPIMKLAAAVVTDHGGRTSHAAIVSRELGLPAIVGTGTATSALRDGDIVTVSCAEGDVGNVYAGRAEFEKQSLDTASIPKHAQVMLNVANPPPRFAGAAADRRRGLARIEFIIGHDIKAHPLALVRPEAVASRRERSAIEKLTRGWPSPQDYIVAKLASGIARIAAAHHPRPVIVRMSDFKTNEYARLLGGAAFEPKEENPMWLWARAHYTDYREGFALECRAPKRARGLASNAIVDSVLPNAGGS